MITKTEEKVVIIPEEVPADMMQKPPCDEVDEITWSDGKNAADIYRRCKDLRGQRIDDLVSTINGRWKWLREQAAGVEADNQIIADKVKEETEEKGSWWNPFD